MTDKSVSERLQKSIVLCSALGILAISVIVALVSIVPLYSHLKESADSNLLLARNTNSRAVEEYLTRAQDVALQITSRTRIRETLEAYNRGEINLDELVDFSENKLLDAMNISAEVAGISRLDPGGELVVQVGVPIPEAFWLVPAGDSKEAVVHGPVTLEEGSYLVVGAAIINNQSERVGTDIVLFELERLQQIVQDYTGLGETGETVLGVAGDDQIQLLFPLRKSNVAENVSKSSPIGLALERAFQQEAGILRPGEVYDSPEVMAYGPVAGSEWGIVVKMDQEELYAPVIGQIVPTGSIILGLLLLGAFGMGLLIRPLTGRMVLLEREVRAKTVALESELDERKRTEEELQERRDVNMKIAVVAKERSDLQQWIDTFDTFVGKFDPNGVGILFNETPIKAGGVTKGEVVGKYFPNTKWWSHSEIERARIVECFERAKAGLSSRIETTFRSADGTPVPIIFNCQPVIDDKGKVNYITAEGKTIIEEVRLRTELQEAKDALEIRVRERTSELIEANEKLKKEIAERKQAEQALCQKVNDLAALYQASQMFLGQINMETTLENACQLAVERFGMKMAWAGLVVEGDYNVHPVAAYGFEEGYLSSIHVTWDNSPTGRGPTGTAIRTAQAVALNQIDTDPNYKPWRSAAMERGYCSSAALPLLYGENVLGVLNVYSGEPEHFTTDQLQLLQSLANLAALGLQQARLYEQVQRHAAELEQRVAGRTAELRAANEKIQKRADELTTLYEVGRDLAVTLDLDVLLPTIAQRVTDTLEADRCSVFLFDERAKVLQARAAYGYMAERLADFSYRPGEEVVGQAYATGEPQYVPDLELVPDLPRRNAIRAILAVPLVSPTASPLGVLSITSLRPEAFTPNQQRLLETMASQIGGGIENARLLQRQQVAVSRLRTLNELMVGIVSAHALNKTLDAIAQATVDLLGCDMAAVAFYDPNSDEIYIPVEYGHRGFDHAFVKQFRLPSGSGAGSQAFAEGCVIVIPDTRADGIADQAQAKRAGIRAMLVGPLQTQEHKLGVLYATQHRPYAFSEDEVALFSILANQAAVAIENARLYDDLQARSRELETTNTAMLDALKDLTAARAELEARAALLEEAKKQAEAADRLKSAFLATMSHELRTPLNSIIGFTGIILQGLVGSLTEEQAKQLEMVRGSARHLLNLINDVLDISKIEAGQVEIILQPFDMRAAIEKVVQTMTPLVEKKGLALVSKMAPEVGQIVSDRRRVEQIIINLVNNAVKFTEQGEVRVECQINDGRLVTRVVDTGIGIKPEDMGVLFETFRQIDTGLTRNHEGTGLGLSICKKLVKMLGGEIWAESEWGVGSTFTFTLPVDR